MVETRDSKWSPRFVWSAARIRQGASALVLLCGLLLVSTWVNDFVPFSEWIAWRLALHFLASALFLVSCLGMGLSLLSLVDRSPSRTDERVVLSLTLGTLASFSLIFGAGLMGALGSTFFFVLPALQLALGGKALLSLFRHQSRVLSKFGFALFRPRTWPEASAVVLGLLGCLLLYAQMVTPANLGADTHWYHLPIAEHYATSGAITPFVEGWYPGAYPQLASVLYTWAFCLPFGVLADKTYLVSHLEWVFFLATLGSLGVLVRRVAGRGRFPFAGAVLFLFPGIFVYDSGLIGAADHILAFLVPPLGLALFRFLRLRTTGSAVVLALVLSTTALCKSQGVYFVPFAAGSALFVMVRYRELRAPLVLAAVALLATSPHWLKNWLWYGDPVYPLLHSVFPSPGTYEGAMDLLPQGLQEPRFRPQGSGMEFWGELFLTSFDFSFVPHNWKPFHGDRPVFGFLYTLFLPLLVFQKRAGRALFLALGVQCAIAVWFSTFQQDRYLQAALPWMVVVTAVGLHRAWTQGLLVRVLAGALVLFQFVYALDLPFLQTHAMAGGSPLTRTIRFAAAGHEGKHEDRLRIWGTLQDAAKVIPEDALLLMHDVQEQLGVGVPTISDRLRWQSRIHYARPKTARDAAKMLADLNTSHVLWPVTPSLFRVDDLANEVAFADLMTRFAGKSDRFGRFRVAAWSEVEPGRVPERALRVGVVSCQRHLRSGIYDVGVLARGGRPVGRLTRDSSGLDGLVLEKGCRKPQISRKGFSRFTGFDEWEIWSRRAPLSK